VVGTHTPGRVSGRYVSGAFVASFWRLAKTAAPTFSPRAMPATLAGLSGTLSTMAPKAASMRAFWPGYCRMRISRAADAAAASAEAFWAAGMSGVKRVYRLWTALTASDMATCIIAIADWFQSVMTSALDGEVTAIRARPAIAVLRAFIAPPPLCGVLRVSGTGGSRARPASLQAPNSAMQAATSCSFPDKNDG
jgi:hypothetical protein